MSEPRDREIKQLEAELFPTHDDFLGDNSAGSYVNDRDRWINAKNDFLDAKLGRPHTRDDWYNEELCQEFSKIWEASEAKRRERYYR